MAPGTRRARGDVELRALAMIGVIADPVDHPVVREFFELFKTPWEFHRKDRQYDVVLCAGDCPFGGTANLFLLYAGKKTHFDEQQKIQTGQQRQTSCMFLYGGERIPIYGDAITFAAHGSTLLTDEGSQECAGYLEQTEGRQWARVGYDLFAEVRKLLVGGQPPVNASIPSLDLHIAFLRNLITACGISFVEIPPVPEGFRFIVCLTHDVDHPSIRKHKWDHTILGFLFRAIFGSLYNVLRDRMSFRDAFRNWVAAIKIPFVYMGFAKDFWHDFDDRYLELEQGLSSTFFVIPYKNQSGRTVGGSAPRFRASRYEAKELEGKIRKLIATGCEVGLHGIDAWLESSKAREELEVMRRLTGISEVGVRMHWLYYNEKSPAVLEEAGAAYDSTIGYNETVGYRAGTTQVYKFLEASQLLELPLHVMDTALFYRSHLSLSPKLAWTLLGRIMDDAVRFGGCLTINWHDRSIAPERLWGGCYSELIEDLKKRGAWFATAREAVAWFKKRRSVVFEVDPQGRGAVHTKVRVPGEGNTPGLKFRHNEARQPNGFGTRRSEDYVDKPIHEHADTRVI
jgi:peptidoglycan/xylan/chitin deacetylase (PgdA/CDA1 family)